MSGRHAPNSWDSYLAAHNGRLADFADHFLERDTLAIKTSAVIVAWSGALDLALDLFDLTLADGRWRDRLKEIARAREVVCDFLVGDNECGSTAESLDRHFLPFAMAARRDR